MNASRPADYGVFPCRHRSRACHRLPKWAPLPLRRPEPWVWKRADWPGGVGARREGRHGVCTFSWCLSSFPCLRCSPNIVARHRIHGATHVLGEQTPSSLSSPAILSRRHTVRTLFVMSLVCALMSLPAIFGVSAIDFVPGPGGEKARMQMMLFAGAFVAAWLCLAFWVRARQRAASRPSPPQWLTRLLICVSVVYLLGVLCCVIG